MNFLLFKPHYLFLNTVDYNNFIFLNQPNIFRIPSLLPEVSNSIYDITPTIKFMGLHNSDLPNVLAAQNFTVKRDLIKNVMLDYDVRIEDFSENILPNFIAEYCNTIALN
jgi:hypothetical protein